MSSRTVMDELRVTAERLLRGIEVPAFGQIEVQRTDALDFQRQAIRAHILKKQRCDVVPIAQCNAQLKGHFASISVYHKSKIKCLF